MLRSYASLTRSAAFHRRWPSASGLRARQVACVLRQASTSTKDEIRQDGPKERAGRPRKRPDATLKEDYVVKPVKKHGRPRKTTQPNDDADAAQLTSPRLRSTRKKVSPERDTLPRLALSASASHNDLASFLRHAEEKKLNPNSSLYKGTHFEYTCQSTLQDRNYNFELYRTGRANDLGVDLVGYWKLPSHDGHETDIAVEKRSGGERQIRKLKVLAQCKVAGRPAPAHIRELEGAYAGAPSGWNSSATVLALLLTSAPATKGVLAALQRSRWPMGLLQITREEGVVRQFVWNAVAGEVCGLQGLGVVERYGRKTEEEETGSLGARLTWRGRVWRG